MRELLFADDSALVAHSTEEMQKIVDAFSDASKKFDLKINFKKTEVLTHQTLQEPERSISRKQAELCSGIHPPRKHYIK